MHLGGGSFSFDGLRILMRRGLFFFIEFYLFRVFTEYHPLRGVEAVGEHEASPNDLVPSGSDLVRSVED